MSNNKLKDKIEKLLNLSMSDNEHEASIALEKALKLMSEHNITKDEVYRQNFISKKFDIDNRTLPDWKIELYTSMAGISGCVFAWRNGFGYSNTRYEKVQGCITGRERDVENAVYLCAFLEREIEKQSKLKRKTLQDRGYEKISTYLKNFKKGIIKMVTYRLYTQQNKFFNENVEKGLVCVDLKSRCDDSMAFLENEEKPKKHKSKAKVLDIALADGVKTGEKIELNQAVSKQDEIMAIESK